MVCQFYEFSLFSDEIPHPLPAEVAFVLFKTQFKTNLQHIQIVVYFAKK